MSERRKKIRLSKTSRTEREDARKRKRLGLLTLAGKVEYFDDYDHKALRRTKR